MDWTPPPHDYLEGGLIVSCQPVEDGPLDSVAAIVGFALAARNAGARALRIEGHENVAAVAKACDLPIIGIVKRDLNASPVRITPFIDDVDALASAGAAIIAVDATDRDHPVPVGVLLSRIHAHGRLAMADISNWREAQEAKALGFDILGTTMSGYCGSAVPEEPDLELVSACRRLGGTVVAEGRYNTPASAAMATCAGASAVCVGSAITRPEHVTRWFKAAIDHAQMARVTSVLALDIGGSKVIAALVRGGVLLEKRLMPTPPAVATDAWFEGIEDFVSGWVGRYERIGVAVTGLIEDGCWSALNPITLAIPERTPLVKRLDSLLGRPTIALNDAQAAAWGEYRHGAGRGKDMAFITVSSGIGGGIVLNGRLLIGANGLAGSLGQVQGTKTGTRLESRASGFAIASCAAAAGQDADTRKVFAAAQAGATWARDIIGAAANALAIGLVDLQRLLDPEVVVLGGGIGLLPAFQASLDDALANIQPRLRPRIASARLGADAGIIGIADYASFER